MSSSRKSSSASNRSTRDRLRAQMHAFQFRTQSALGQCFLIDEGVLNAIADAATAENPGVVIEIGAGPGTLTCALARRGARVVAIERDAAVIPLFHANVANHPQVQLVQGDALALAFAGLSPEVFRPAIAGNLPYNITSPLLLTLLAQRDSIGPTTVMIQKEVAERLTAAPGCKAYGSLTVLFNLHANIRILFDVPAQAFEPEPAVISTVLRIEWLETSRMEVPTNFEEVVRRAFGQRRKTLRNALLSHYAKEQVQEAGEASDIDLSRRGETLSLSEFSRLAVFLKDQRAR